MYPRGRIAEANQGMDKDASEYYADIINLPHPRPKNRVPMSMLDRAAQFSAFAALSGHGDAVHETECVTSQQMELSENTPAKLDYLLHQIQTSPGSEICLTYFMPDTRKSDGEYCHVRGRVTRAEAVERRLVMDDGSEIPLDMISDMELKRT